MTARELAVMLREEGIESQVPERVPVKTLLDYLASGDNLDEFLDDFPTVRRRCSRRGQAASTVRALMLTLRLWVPKPESLPGRRRTRARSVGP